MKVVSINEAKTHLSRLLRLVASGQEITIAKRGVPVARLVPVPTRVRKLGMFAGKIKISDDFDKPLPDDILDLFEGREQSGPERKNHSNS